MRNRNKMVTTRSNENYVFIRVDKELLIEFISKTIFYIIALITVASIIALIGTAISMVEAWNITKEGIIVCLVCSVWLGLVTLAYKILTK